MTGPERAQHLRMLVGTLWWALGERDESHAPGLLRRLSQEVEKLARQLEVGHLEPGRT
jgi:hypothetical protein